MGITPAHAGKSIRTLLHKNHKWDHPRTRGEKEKSLYFSSISPGSPPHTRGKAETLSENTVNSGITPAHAGKSL